MVSRINIIKIKNLMKRKRYTFDDLAIGSGIDLETMKVIIKRERASIKSIIKLAKGLDVGITEIMLKREV